MMATERILVGMPVPMLARASKELEVAELGGDFVDLPAADEVKQAAGRAAVTLVAWHVLTHRRNDPMYKGMSEPPPEHAAVGHFERSRWTDEAWERTDALARRLRAQAVVLRTPRSFKSSREHGMRLENFVAHAGRPGLALAWEWAPGSWPEAKALETAERLGLVPVIDPTESAIPDADVLYLRFRGGASGKKPLRDDDLKRAALRARDTAGWAIFCNRTAAQDAARFAEML